MTQRPEQLNPNSKPFPWPCAECGAKRVHPSTQSYFAKVKHDGKLYAFEIPQFRCPKCEACGELVMDNAADEQISEALRKHLGLLGPEEIRGRREMLGLTQCELSDLTGIAEETISRWETGGRIQSRAMDKLLRLTFDVEANNRQRAMRASKKRRATPAP